MAQLWQLTAQALAARIAAGQASASEAIDSVLQRIEQVNPRLNALPVVLADSAREAAREADRRQAAGMALGPLHGVPVSIKNNQDIAGHATTEGSTALQANIAPDDSPLVANLRAAGAIVVGISNTPALSMRWFTRNDLHGQTLNPWDAQLTPGGSSGGAAVAVACGMGPIAHGNDTAGSIRYPAYACGVYGLRPTPGRIPAYKHTAPARGISHQLFTVQGPLARTVADVRLAFAAMARGSPLDPLWVPAPLEEAPGAQRMRIGVFSQHPDYPVHPQVRQSLLETAGVLARAGCAVEETSPPVFEELGRLFGGLSVSDMRRKGVDAVRRMGDDATRTILERMLARAPVWDRDDCLEALARRLELMRAWNLWLEAYDAVLMPVSWEPPFLLDQDLGDERRYEAMVRAQSPLVATACLGMPSLVVPVGQPAPTDTSPPLGVQLLAQPFAEARLLRVAQAIEDSMPAPAPLPLSPALR
jgi:amidase